MKMKQTPGLNLFQAGGIYIRVLRQLSEAKQRTARYAGEKQKVIPKNHQSGTIRKFRPIVTRKVIMLSKQQLISLYRLDMLRRYTLNHQN